MYNATFAVDSIGSNDPEDIELSKEHMQILLDAATAINKAYMRRRRYPDILRAGVRYNPDRPPRGSICGDDAWCDIEVSLRRKIVDCDDVAPIRAAQLQMQGVRARAIALLRATREKHDYHIVVAWPNGLPRYPGTVYRDPSGSGLLLEDPSRILGMK